MESDDEGRRPFACIMVQEEHFDYGLFAITKELEELLVPKIPNTMDVCKDARKNLNWRLNPSNGLL